MRSKVIGTQVKILYLLLGLISMPVLAGKSAKIPSGMIMIKTAQSQTLIKRKLGIEEPDIGKQPIKKSPKDRLFEAIKHDQAAKFKKLINANPSNEFLASEDDQKNTIVHVAVLGGNTRMVKTVLEHLIAKEMIKQIVNKKNKKEQTAHDIACKQNNVAIQELLEVYKVLSNG